MIFPNCKHKTCKKKAIFFTDYCLEHTENQEELIKKIHNFIKDNNIISGYNFSYVPLDNLDMSGKEISFSFFFYCSMHNVNLSKSKILSTFFAFADLENSDISNSFIRFSIFGGANLTRVNFLETIAYSSNFLGANIEETNFKNTDLSYSRFISSIIKNTSFNNCNLKNTFLNNEIDFDSITQKTSNFQDAILISCDDNECTIKGLK